MTIKVKYKVDFAQVNPASVFTQWSGDSKPVRRVARQLALAHHVEELIDQGRLRDYADAARRIGLTRARLSQVLNLQFLAPSIQEQILSGKLLISERQLRPILRRPVWKEQESMVGTEA